MEHASPFKTWQVARAFEFSVQKNTKIAWKASLPVCRLAFLTHFIDTVKQHRCDLTRWQTRKKQKCCQCKPGSWRVWRRGCLWPECIYWQADCQKKKKEKSQDSVSAYNKQHCNNKKSSKNFHKLQYNPASRTISEHHCTQVPLPQAFKSSTQHHGLASPHTAKFISSSRQRHTVLCRFLTVCDRRNQRLLTRNWSVSVCVK